jgi:hypothetical protein
MNNIAGWTKSDWVDVGDVIDKSCRETEFLEEEPRAFLSSQFNVVHRAEDLRKSWTAIQN